MGAFIYRWQFYVGENQYVGEGLTEEDALDVSARRFGFNPASVERSLLLHRRLARYDDGAGQVD